MDLGHVAFAGLTKFDGRRHRRLHRPGDRPDRRARRPLPPRRDVRRHRRLRGNGSTSWSRRWKTTASSRCGRPCGATPTSTSASLAALLRSLAASAAPRRARRPRRRRSTRGRCAQPGRRRRPSPSAPAAARATPAALGRLPDAGLPQDHPRGPLRLVRDAFRTPRPPATGGSPEAWMASAVPAARSPRRRDRRPFAAPGRGAHPGLRRQPARLAGRCRPLARRDPRARGPAFRHPARKADGALHRPADQRPDPRARQRSGAAGRRRRRRRGDASRAISSAGCRACAFERRPGRRRPGAEGPARGGRHGRWRRRSPGAWAPSPPSRDDAFAASTRRRRPVARRGGRRHRRRRSVHPGGAAVTASLVAAGGQGARRAPAGGVRRRRGRPPARRRCASLGRAVADGRDQRACRGASPGGSSRRAACSIGALAETDLEGLSRAERRTLREPRRAHRRLLPVPPRADRRASETVRPSLRGSGRASAGGHPGPAFSPCPRRRPPSARSACAVCAVGGLAVPVETLERLDQALRDAPRRARGRGAQRSGRAALGWSDGELRRILARPLGSRRRAGQTPASRPPGGGERARPAPLGLQARDLAVRGAGGAGDSALDAGAAAAARRRAAWLKTASASTSGCGARGSSRPGRWPPGWSSRDAFG